jgi:hypothetical protein
MQTLFNQPPVDVATTTKIDFRRVWNRVLNRLHFSPLAIKCGVILLFTVLWLVVALVRSTAPRDAESLETSSLTTLARLQQENFISGRDFQSVFGPGMQYLVATATSLTKAPATSDAHAMIAFFLSAGAAILIGITLLLCDLFSWKESAIGYGLCFLLNLFFGTLDFRIALLLLSAVLAYRITAAEDLNRHMIWAAATALVCFFSQLVSFELGIYEVLIVVPALILTCVLSRSITPLPGIAVFGSTLAGANIALVLLFKLTSSRYGMMFDYQNYSLEILRGYHNNMGVLWALAPWKTGILIAAALYAVIACVVVARSSGLEGAPLYLSLALAAVVWLSTCLVESDIPHIAAAFTPMVLVLGLIGTRLWQYKETGVLWAVALAGLFVVWPSSFNFSAPLDIVHVVQGRVSLRQSIRNIYSPGRPPESSSLPVSLATADNFVVPVLESYAAGTDPLQTYYIQALDRHRPESLNVANEPDEDGVAQSEHVQAITRTPRIFEYLYKHFELAGNAGTADGLYKLRERYPSAEPVLAPIEYSVPRQLADRGEMNLMADSTCGLVRLQMQIDYAKSPLLFRPQGVELNLSDKGEFVWRGVIQPLAFNEPFTTYISTLPAKDFRSVFGQSPIQSGKWNRIEYSTLPADALGSRAEKIRIEAIQCVDPQKYAGS